MIRVQLDQRRQEKGTEMSYYEKWTLIPSPEMGISHLPVLLINHVLVSSPSMGLRKVIPFSSPPFFLVCVASMTLGN